ECLPSREVMCPQPCAYSRNLEPCVTSCGDSRAVVFAPPVVLTFPGPTLNSCSQESVVGTSFPPSFGALTPNSSNESYEMGGSFASGGIMSGMRGSFGSGGSFG
ncbi:KRFJ protein, partial [Sclerurus mexicanus]|nr:KRFJ protein [Sclerurus mexicanus]